MWFWIGASLPWIGGFTAAYVAHKPDPTFDVKNCAVWVDPDNSAMFKAASIHATMKGQVIKSTDIINTCFVKTGLY
jgi:hypothetical protein